MSPPAIDPKNLPKATLTLHNYAKRKRRIAELPTHHDDLRYAQGLSWVLRFEDGSVAVAANRGPMFRGGGPTPCPKLLEVSAEGATSGKWDFVSEVLVNRRDAKGKRPRGKKFCVTAVVEEIGLKSNTVFLNGMFELPPKFDPLEDLKTHRRLVQEWKKKEAEEAKKAAEEAIKAKEKRRRER